MTNNLATPLLDELPREDQPSLDFNFDAYRELCDENTTGSRKAGLLDQELAHAAVVDSRTDSLMLDGQLVPVITPIEHAAGYDAKRSATIATRLAEKPVGEAYIVALPMKLIANLAVKVSNEVIYQPSAIADDVQYV